MGSQDLAAIRAGAMDPAGRRRTRIGYWCGLMGTLIGVIPFVMAILAIIFSF